MRRPLISLWPSPASCSAAVPYLGIRTGAAVSARCRRAPSRGRPTRCCSGSSTSAAGAGPDPARRRARDGREPAEIAAIAAASPVTRCSGSRPSSRARRPRRSAGRADQRRPEQHGGNRRGHPAALHDRPAGRRRRGPEPGLLQHLGQLPADRLRAGALAELPGAADRVPLDRHPGGCDRHEPALGGRGIRPADAGCAGRSRRRDLRVPAGAGDRGMDPALPVRGPVRALDGLPRVPDVADP